ncbi:hypothetical protein Dvina_19815 [Dactylosporangium vinaceum]|uniref:Uncharacterized protein n=1 Tax=Dactylosporangium vinaceum TaxID=53362 RepID=A0ABV5M9Q9_9ACTN|nr:hypothetical protein [Dactylosporangium vinaceum]UAC00105.1 hypothetical protein Dvina_19815 [Dactylosporangium vinaceum]
MAVSQQPDEWQDALTEAFCVLLGKSLREFDPDASYAVYYSCSDLAIELFKAGFDAGPLARGEIVHPPFPTIPVLGSLLEGWHHFAAHWSIDLGRSAFYAGDPGDGAAIGLPELDTGLLGVELGRILTERSLTPRKIRKAYPEIEFRVHTDGTLFDAMRAITGTMRGPDHLFPLSPGHGVDREWHQRLGAVTHPGLRDHLRHFCRTENSARSDGAFYLGTEDPGFEPPRPVLAAWQVGEAQSWSAVVQVP